MELNTNQQVYGKTSSFSPNSATLRIINQLAQTDKDSNSSLQPIGFASLYWRYFFNVGFDEKLGLDKTYPNVKLTRKQKKVIMKSYFSAYAKNRANKDKAKLSDRYSFNLAEMFSSIWVLVVFIICGILVITRGTFDGDLGLGIAFIVIGIVVSATILIVNLMTKTGWFYGNKPLYVSYEGSINNYSSSNQIAR